jgi:hypothetical protein
MKLIMLVHNTLCRLAGCYTNSKKVPTNVVAKTLVSEDTKNKEKP